MPPSNLPAHAKEIYTAAEENAKKTTCKNRQDKDACAAKIAWSAVKNKYKKVGEKWVPKADVEFSLFINKASFDKKTQEMRWSAVASDTDEDSFGDSMTSELFDSFLSRIENNEEAPEQYRSEYWNGGMPYLSLAHYPDLNGKAVPGPVDSVFRDGNRLKSRGRFYNTPLGRACFNSVCDDLYSEKRSDADDKVRISIGFLDYKHKHKSNDFIFERKSLDEICPECVKETLTKIMTGEQSKGKYFLDGQLIHEALTRVPVNKRTDITVERSMVTQKEDALSILGEDGEEIFEEDIEKALSVEKSGALITKSMLREKLREIDDAWREKFSGKGSNSPYTYVVDVSDEENYVIAYYDEKYYKVDYSKSDSEVKFSQKSDWKEVKKESKWVTVVKSMMLEDGFFYIEESDVSFVEDSKHGMEEDCPEDDKDCKEKMKAKSLAEVDRAVTKKESWGAESSGSYLIVEDPQKPTTWHLPVKKHGKIDHGLMGAAKAALTAAKGHRGNQYKGPGKAKAISKLKALYKKEGLEWKSEVLDMDVEELTKLVEGIVGKSVAEAVKDVKPEPTNDEPPKEHPLDVVLAEIKSAYDGAIEQKLDPQKTLAALQEPMEHVGKAILTDVQKVQPAPDMNTEVVKALSELTQAVALLKAQVNTPAPTNGVPNQRSFAADVYQKDQQAPTYQVSETPGLQNLVRKSVGLNS